MSTDLGHLFATLDIKDDQFKSKIAAAKTDLLDLKKAADDASKVSLDIKPKGAAEVDKAADSTDKLNEAQKQADKTTVNVAPTGKTEVDAAAKATKDLEAAEKGADKAKVDVKPTGTADLDKAATSADGLGKKLDDAGAKSPDVAPTGADQLDRAAASATGLGDNLDHVSGPDVSPTGASELDSASSAGKDLDITLDNVDGPDVTPTGTGDVTTAAAEAGVLDQNLQKAGQSGKNLSVSTQPAQELDNASNAAGGLVDKLGEVAAKTAGKAMKWGAVTAGTAAVGGLGVALTKGFSRLDSIDQANAKLQGLGHSAQDIDAIMASAMDSVKGTAYGFGDAASLAAQMVASGIEPGEELTGVLTTVADTAAIAGRDLNDMGLIFGSVAAKGKLQGDDLLQLMAGGIPVLQMLAEETGKTTEEVSKMATEGEISFEIFESAMKNSLGGAAQDAGNTFKGSMDNAGAAIGRFGAELLKPAFEAAPGIIGGITDKIDDATAAVGPFVQEWSGKLASGLSDFAQNIGPQVAGTITTIKDGLGLLKDGASAVAPAVSGVGSALKAVPMEAWVGLLGMAVAKHKGLTGALSNGTSVVKGWGTAVKGTQSSLQAQGREIGVVSSAMLTMQQRVPVIGRMGGAYRKAGDGMRLAGMESRGAAREMTGLNRIVGTAKGTAQSFGGVLSGSVAGGMSLVKSGAGGLMSALGGPWGLAIGAATTAIFGLISKHQEAAAAEAEHKRMQDELRDSLDQTTGSITKQTEELQLKNLEERHEGARENATKMGISETTLTRALTGNDRARASVGRAGDAYLAEEVTGSDFWNEYGSRLESQGVDETDMGRYLAAMDREDYDAASDTGFSEAMSELGISSSWRTGYGSDLKDLRDGAKEATEAVNDLTEGIGDGNHNLEKMSELSRANAMQEFAVDAGAAKDAFKILADEVDQGKVRMEDPATIAVEMDATRAAEVKAELKKIGIEAEYNTETKELEIDMPSGAGILEVLKQIGVELDILPDGTINLESNTDEEKQKLVDLGLATEIDGEIVMKDDIQSKIQDLVNLGAAAVIGGEIVMTSNSADMMAALDGIGIKTRTLPDGRIQITDTSAENLARLNEIGVKTVTLPDGRVVLTDNTGEVKSNIDSIPKQTTGDHTVRDNVDQTKLRIDGLRGRNTTSTHTVYNSVVTQQGGGGYNQLTDAGYSDAEAWMLMDGYESGGKIPYLAGGGTAGGRLPVTGPGTGVVDGILGVDGAGMPTARVNAGEWVVNDESSDAWDGTLAAINGGRPSQVVAAMLADLEQFANGGKVADRVKSGTAYMDGTPYIFGGWSPAGVDCSGAVSLGVNRAMGLDDFDSRCGTANMGDWLAAKGFQAGQGSPGDIRVGWYNGGPGGGHTAMQLGDGTFIESGGNTGGGYTIGKSAGPLAGRGFTDWMFLPGNGGEPDGGDIGDAGSGSYSSYSSSAGGSSGGGGSSVSKSVNGGAGPLLKDGSVLEAAAAAYSLQTGQPMPDDVVSWGNVLGLGTTFEGENLETEQRRHEREMRAHDRNITATERDLAQAKKDVGEKEKALAEADPEDKEQAQWELDDARDKVADLSDKLIDMRDETEELRKTNEQLKVAVEKQKAAPQSAGQAFGITAMADGGILGNARSAQINEGSATLWAEAGPEAYIPLSRNKRARSLDLWAETGKRLGVDVLSMANLVGSGLPGLMDGKLQFSTGDTTSLDRMGLNMDAAKHAGGREIGSAVGAVFNGPVTVNDPRGYLQGQLNTASRQINKAMKSRMLLP